MDNQRRGKDVSGGEIDEGAMTTSIVFLIASLIGFTVGDATGNIIFTIGAAISAIVGMIVFIVALTWK